MFWVQFLVALAFTVVGELLRPKPRFDKPRPTSLGDYRAPTADEARPIPVAYGTVKITGPNAVWWGDFEARPITKKVKTGMFSSDRITLGYQYWLGMQLALCWGEVDELIGLEFDEKPVPLLNRVNTADLVSFMMDAPKLFSSDDPNNGLKGQVRFYPGRFTQVANSYLSRQWGELSIPAYRGICYVVFEKCYLSNNDTVPPIAWTIRRTPNTLGLTGGRENINGDANPACALFEIMTNTFWGASVPQAAIDTTSFVNAANALHAEGLGISMLIDNGSTADGIMDDILRHIDGVVFIDPETGKFTLKLARNDYVVASLPLLDPSNIEADSFKYTRGSWDETKNTVKIKYIDRAQKYTERVVQHQNLANITVRGGQVDADEFDFTGLSNPTSANAVAARVLKTVSSPLSRLECEINRTQFGLRPGSVFRLSWPQLGIEQMVYRVTEIDYGTLDSGLIKIRAVEDVFSVAAVSFIDPPGSGWQNPFGPVAPVLRQSAFEVPYALLGTLNTDRYVAVTASPSKLADIGYRIVQDTAGGTTFVDTRDQTNSFTPNGQLSAALLSSGAASAVSLSIINGYALDRVAVPTSAEVAAGSAIARIISTAGEELVSYTGITVNDTSATLTGVTRAVYDTIPLDHPAGATIWFVSEGVGTVQDSPYPSDLTTRIRVLPYNQRDSLAVTSATDMTVAISSRANRPYPPGGPTFNGTYRPATFTGALTVGWTHRDRLTQGRTPTAQNSGSVGPEATVTYTVRFYDETNTLRRTYTAVAGTSQLWDTEEADCGLVDVAPGTPGVEAAGIRDACVYFYPLSETTGTTVRDLEITSPLNLTNTNGTPNQTAIRTGGTPSVAMSSTNRITSAIRPAEILSTATYSMAGWFRFTSWSSTHNALCAITEATETEAGNFRLLVYVNASRQLVYAHEYGAGVDEVVVATGMAALALATNYQIAATVDQPTKTVRFYVNGALVDTRTYVNNFTGATSANLRLVLGSDSPTGATATTLNGRLQDVFFTTDLLTDAEIAWLYNGGSGRSVLDTIGSTPRLNNSVRVEIESVRGSTTSFYRQQHTARRVGAQTGGGVTVPGNSLAILGDVSTGAATSTTITAQLTAAGVTGTAVWSMASGSATQADISGIGVLTFSAATAGVYSFGVALTDSATSNSVTRNFTVEVGAGTPTAAVSGNLLDGYVGAPYLVNALIGEGIVLSRPASNNYWVGHSSTSSPNNVYLSTLSAGTPTAAGTFNYSIVFGQWGSSKVTHNGTVNILATPTTAIWNAFDRYITYGTVKFLPGPAPFLQCEGTPVVAGSFTFAGSIRAAGGYTTGKRYWEVRVDKAPALLEEALSIGIDRSNRFPGNGNSQYFTADPTLGEWGYEMKNIGVGPQALTTGFGNGVAQTAPNVTDGAWLRFAHDADAGNLWVGIGTSGWIGGGDPATGTNPTLRTTTFPGTSFWSQFRPLAVLRGAVRITANFGAQAWSAGGPPSGFTTVPFQNFPAAIHQVWDNDTATVDSGTFDAGIAIGNGGNASATDETRFLAISAGARLDSATIAAPHSVLGSLPQSTGKWVFEMIVRGYGANTLMGLAPFDWDRTGLPRLGYTADTFAVRRATATNPTNGVDTANGEVMNANVQASTFAFGGSVFTFRCDFDASPKTVQVLRDGVVLGTYNLPNTGKPWVPALAVGLRGGAILQTRGVQFPGTGFTPWNPLGTN